jgi:hypothetical protein
MKLGPIGYAAVVALACAGFAAVAPTPADAASCPKNDVRVHVCLQWSGHKGSPLKITGRCLRYGGYKCYPRNPVIK